jgi:flagellar protein FlaI
MLDLMVNSLRMRPDRIIVGEIRREREAEVLFEAIHTGHSVYATVHANSAEETVTRLTSPPINVPKSMLSALSLICTQYRNRRTGIRRTFQLAEITKDGEANILRQLDLRADKIKAGNKSKSVFKTLNLYTGVSHGELQRNLKKKAEVLKALVKHELNTVDMVGTVMAEYYRDPNSVLKKIPQIKKDSEAKVLKELKARTLSVKPPKTKEELKAEKKEKKAKAKKEKKKKRKSFFGIGSTKKKGHGKKK